MRVENILLELARLSILRGFNDSFYIDREQLSQEFPILSEHRATFVTLTLNGKLRGCIGSLLPHTNLLDDVIQNAHKSAFLDHRFSPLTQEEFKKITIEISILTPPVKLDYVDENDLKEKVVPLKHGVILQCENKQATFLPQVWEQIPNFEDFFTHLSLKAGFKTSCLVKKPTIYLYTVTKIK